MSRIFPAGGGKKVSWMDKVEEGQEEEKEELIGTAALDLKTLRKLAGFGDKSEDDKGSDDEEDVKPEEADEAKEGEKPDFLKGDDKEVSKDEDKGEEGEEHEEGETKEFEAGEGEEKAEAGPAVEQAVAAVEKAKDALEEVSIALEDAGGTAGGDEVADVPVSLEGDVGAPSDDAMVEVEIGGDMGGAMGADIGADVGADAGAGCEKCPVCGADKPADGSMQSDVISEIKDTPMNTQVVANTSSKFYKIAALSPVNKKKLKDYWIGSLGYDAEFVGMMLKDYNPKVGGKKE